MLIYGLDDRQLRRIEHIRSNVYALRDFLRDEDLAHSVAHATYSVNRRLTAEHLEKLILLSDVFEGQNGARDAIHNEGWSGNPQDLAPETGTPHRRNPPQEIGVARLKRSFGIPESCRGERHLVAWKLRWECPLVKNERGRF